MLSKGKEQIVDYFEQDEKLEQELASRGKEGMLSDLARYNSVQFSVRYQDEQKGDGHAILQAADFVESESVAILFGDDLFYGAESGLMQLARAHESVEPDAVMIALQDVDRSLTSSYGIVDVSNADASMERLYAVRDLVEKPAPEDAPSTMGVVGKYIIPRQIFDALPSVESGVGGEIRLIDAFIAQKDALPLYGYLCEGTRLDTGNPAGYKKALDLLCE